MTTWKIIRKNVCTVFNLLNVMIALLLFMAGAYSNMLFMAIIILNTLIGIAQELKAKKMVEELSILNQPMSLAERNGREVALKSEEVKQGDILILQSGDQVSHDGIVLEGSILEADESMLTGESDGVVKEAGDQLLSGSMILSGKGRMKVTHVGEENYAQKLAAEVKKEKEAYSELLWSMRNVTHLTSFLIVPLGVLLLLEAVLLRNEEMNSAIVSSSAALLGMLPKGLVLLISVSLAAGVIRLAQKKILVKDIYSLETLAHTDVVCLDKTGTITSGKMTVKKVIPLWKQAGAEIDEEQAENMARAYLAACSDNNATFQALKAAFLPEGKESPEEFQAVSTIPFSSVRKWGMVAFSNGNCIFSGAPERFFSRLTGEIEEELAKGFRVVAFGYGQRPFKEQDDPLLLKNVTPLFAISLEDQIREHAKETLEYFRQEGMDVKIISGDHIKTVSQAAGRAGLPGWNKAVDMSREGERPDYDRLCREYSVFARVTPQQKRELVRGFQRQGHSVAMAGDGVNDLLALREADCSIAIGEGSDASRQISQIVLLDSDFTYIPQVILEGRRVIHNVTRTSGVFFIKTIYSILVSFLCLILNQPFPFIPIQITLIDAFVEAMPAFLTILEADTRPLSENFLKTAIKNALPFAILVTVQIAVTTLASPFGQEERKTVMYVILAVISMMAVIKSSVPFTKLRTAICMFMTVGFFAVLITLPSLFEMSPITRDMALYIAVMAAAAACLLYTGRKAEKMTGAFINDGSCLGRKAGDGSCR